MSHSKGISQIPALHLRSSVLQLFGTDASPNLWIFFLEHSRIDGEVFYFSGSGVCVCVCVRPCSHSVDTAERSDWV